MSKRKTRSFISQGILTLIFIAVCAAIIIPFLLVVSVSLSNEKDIVEYGYRLIPKNFDFSAYKYVFSNPTAIINAYKVTITYSFVGTFLSVLFMSMGAYVMARKVLKGSSKIAFYFYFTMLFSGGLVPTYMLITQYLHLQNTIWVYILPGLISPWYMFMLRTFFAQLPSALCESAMIDGASEYRIFFQIILPLSKPALATVLLMGFLDRWNEWMTALLYIDDQELVSLQYLLQRIMSNIELLTQQDNAMVQGMMDTGSIPSESARMAMAVVAAGPALVIFPFFQKYFVRGLTVGSVKG